MFPCLPDQQGVGQPITTIGKFGRESRPLCIVTEGLQPDWGGTLVKAFSCCSLWTFSIVNASFMGRREHYCSDEGL